MALTTGDSHSASACLQGPGRVRRSRQIRHPRPNARDHLAFASGIHACLGAALARIEGTTALRALFETFPDLQLTAPPQPRGLVNLRGFARLPVKLGTRNVASLRAV